MRSLFFRFLKSLIRSGNLRIETADGKSAVFGDGGGPRLAVKFQDKAAEWELMLNPALALGELYMNSRVELIEGDLYDLVALGSSNCEDYRRPKWLDLLEKTRVALRRLRQRNTRLRARANVRIHYDLDPRLYDLFLDADRQYSCAYFEYPGQTLDEAQLAKKRHIASKMLLREGDEVLDIGCGFGGMALYLGQIVGARVTGVTLSDEQHAIARRRVAEAGFDERIDIRLQDYRDIEAKFDRIVSVGMFEHVGISHFDEYFAQVRHLLRDDGIMVLHAIGRSEPPSATNPWIEKHIFPGGYVPALSEVTAAIERNGLFVTDVEIQRLHYAETLRMWRERFLKRREEAKAMYDERFCRMWDFYLAGSEASFRVNGHMVFQIQLAKRQDVVPMTRGYIEEREAALRDREPTRIATPETRRKVG